MSRVVVNEIQAKVGNDVTFNSNIANPTTIKGEGSATTNLQQGLAKVWNFFDGTASTIAYADSFNSSTLTDIGGGQYKYAFTNNMGNANFSFGGAALVDETTFGLLTGTEIAGSHARSTSSSGQFFTTNTASVNSAANANSISTQIFGDLA
tara:strand:+ start:513 stop:965 length:453 start_codon:yes stop_codon:yes gene_type:complete